MSGLFLNPWMLLGFAALAAPIIAHLIQRRDRRGHPFPSLMFLRRIPQRVRRRSALRNPWLLALRCLLIVVIAVAFADPRWSRSPEAVGSARVGKDVVLLLDRSYSMGYGDRWQGALTRARETVAALEPFDRVALVTFDTETELLAPLTLQRDVISAALESAILGPGATHFASALAAATDLLADSRAVQREVVLLTDLQRSGLTGGEPRLGADVELTVLPITGAGGVNLTLLPAVFPDRSREARLMARIRNTGTAVTAAAEVTLEVDSRLAASAEIELAAGAEESVGFPVVLPKDRAVPMRLALGEDGLLSDNAFHLVLANPRRIRALIVQDDAFGSRAGLFLSEAMSLSNAPQVRVDRVPWTAFESDLLQAYDLVAFVDAPLPSGQAARDLTDFVAAGGAMLVLNGERLATPLDGALADVVPGETQGGQSAPAGRVRISTLAPDHPLLKPFRETPSFDLSTIFVHRYHRLQTRSSDRVLARLNNGNPIMLERRHGLGRTVLIGTSLDERWSSLGLDPAFAPLVIGLIQHLSGVQAPVAAFRLGDSIDVRAYLSALPGAESVLAAFLAGERLVIETPAGLETIVSETGVVTPEEIGVFEIHRRKAGGRGVPLAVNADRQESDLAALRIDDLTQAIVRTPTGKQTDVLSFTAVEETDAPGFSLAWYLLAAALGAAVLEMLISARMDRERVRYAGGVRQELADR